MGVYSDPLSPKRLPLRWLYPRKYCAEGFRKQLAYLRAHPELRRDADKLSDRAGKRVWKIALPEELGGRTVAFKSCKGKKWWRYLFDLTPPAREFRNYRALYTLGIPAAEVLAYGETRIFGFLLRSFIVTGFIEGTGNGCDFMPEGAERGDLGRRRRFCELLAAHLATLHRHRFFHKALHPRNVLWRGATPEEMEIFFIDMARGRVSPEEKMREAILFDLYTPLRDLELPTEESCAFLDCYLKHFPDAPFTQERLETELRAFLRHEKVFNVIDHPRAR